MKKLIAIVIVMLGLPTAALAQITWNQPAFTNQATSGRSAIMRNVNQSSHWLTYCAGAATSGGTIEIDGSADGTHWVTISNLGVLAANQCGVIQGGGYYPAISAYLSGVAGAGPSINATYSASSGAIATPSNAGYNTTDQPVTMVPIANVQTLSTKSSAYQLSSVQANVLYGATVSNTNSGTVYVAFAGSSTLYVGGGALVFMIPVAANQSVSVALPPQGLSFSGGSGLYVGCSTSPTSAADPSTACVVSAYWKQVATGIVPN